jgi:hypothetical protein
MSGVNNYWLGDQITIYETFTVSGTETNPTGVVFTIVRPDGVTESFEWGVDPEVTNPSTGLFQLAYDAPSIGHYDYRVEASGAVVTAIEGEFNVFSFVPRVDPIYVTALELGAVLRITNPAGDVLDDLDRACNAASRAIDECCDTVFALRDASNDEVRYFTRLSDNLTLIDDAASITSVRVDTNQDGIYDQDWTEGTDYVLLRSSSSSVPPADRPFNRIKVRERSSRWFPRGDQTIEVSGRFGWATTPWQITEAAGLLAQQLFKRRLEAPFGVVSFGIDQPTAVRLIRNDPHMTELLSAFQRIEI